MTKHLSIGLKLGPSVTRNHIDATYEFVDFYELYAQVGCDYKLLEGISKPIILHIPHSSDGTNLADPKKKEINELALTHVLKLADNFNVKKLIFHPELYADDDCSIDALVDFITSHYDERLYVENMPYNCLGIRHMGASADEIAEIKQRCGVNFCLDLAHASEYLEKSSQSLEKLNDFLKLHPSHFHITDTVLDAVHNPLYDEEHVNIGDGTMNFPVLIRDIPSGAQLTLETPMNTEKNLAEIGYIKSLINSP